MWEVREVRACGLGYLLSVGCSVSASRRLLLVNVTVEDSNDVGDNGKND